VGDTELNVSRFGPGGDTTTLIFTATGSLSGSVVLENAGETYTFGTL
jgi:hypothetical protein